jgi:hypothetical protein
MAPHSGVEDEVPPMVPHWPSYSMVMPVYSSALALTSGSSRHAVLTAAFWQKSLPSIC